MTLARKFHLVLSGSGADFPCFLGALKEVTSTYPNIPQNLGSLSASSGGAIIGLLLLLQFSVAVMEDLCFTIEYQKHLQKIDLTNLLGDYGLDNAGNMIKVMKRVIRQRLANPEATLRDLYEFNPCVFNVTSTNLTTMSAVVLNHINTPDLPLWKALRITTSIPFVFTSVRLNGDHMCDGAVLSYYPIHLVPETSIDEHVVGIRIDKAEERNEIKDLISYIVALAKTMSRHVNGPLGNVHETMLHYDNIVLKTVKRELFVMERDLDQKKIMIESGRLQAREYFDSDSVIVKHLVRDIFRRVFSCIE